MKILTFLAKRFAWKSFSKTLDEVEDIDDEREIRDAVVVFLHAEKADEIDTDRNRILRQAVKHTKWLANKRNFRSIVIHSFTHLGAENANPEFARNFIAEMRTKLQGRGFEVWTTPFGYFCEWDLSVYGESLAKVWKQI